MTLDSRSFPAAILLGGFVAGTIDIGAASAINLVSPFLILQAIASGVLGTASFRDGWASAALGLLLQWGMSILIATIFVAAARRITALRQYWIAAGVAYGVVIFFIMNYVVVPLSAVGRTPHFTVQHLLENLLAMILFGLIVAFCARDTPPQRL